MLNSRFQPVFSLCCNSIQLNVVLFEFLFVSVFNFSVLSSLWSCLDSGDKKRTDLACLSCWYMKYYTNVSDIFFQNFFIHSFLLNSFSVGMWAAKSFNINTRKQSAKYIQQTWKCTTLKTVSKVYFDSQEIHHNICLIIFINPYLKIPSSPDNCWWKFKLN